MAKKKAKTEETKGKTCFIIMPITTPDSRSAHLKSYFFEF